MEYHKPGFLSAEIDKFTKLGSEQLQNGRANDACESFELAYKRSKQLDDSFKERACAFNLGAVYISLKKAERGKAIKCDDLIGAINGLKGLWFVPSSGHV